MPIEAKRLITGMRHQTCAVVGNSPSMNDHLHGGEIDAHDVVIRFNFAPTVGYERRVGRRTTVRVMGRSWVWNESESVGTGRMAGELLEEPLMIHRYNNPVYLDEDLKFNKGFHIATLEHTFARPAAGIVDIAIAAAPRQVVPS
jgi:hypothetical protein